MHNYMRVCWTWLGDLSGGQILKRVAIKAMQLPKEGPGTQFYDFPLIPNAKTFKNTYRKALDDTKVTLSTLEIYI